MRRIAATTAILILVGVVLAYASGLLTDTEVREDSCIVCRADRYRARHYGMRIERVTPSVMTTWYLANIDPDHGLRDDHPHTWRPSASVVRVAAGHLQTDVKPMLVDPILLLRPELELAALQNLEQTPMQLALIRSLNTPVRKQATTRVRLLIEYFYLHEADVPWDQWWSRSAPAFGMPGTLTSAR